VCCVRGFRVFVVVFFFCRVWLWFFFFFFDLFFLFFFFLCCGLFFWGFLLVSSGFYNAAGSLCMTFWGSAVGFVFSVGEAWIWFVI